MSGTYLFPSTFVCLQKLIAMTSTIAYFGIINNGYSTSFFTPTILLQFHWTSIHAQVMSIPIYIVACVVALLIAFMTDRHRHRYIFAMLGLVIASIGYILLLCQKSVSIGVRYFAIYLITAGGYTTQPIVLVWLMNNLGGHYKRGIGAAIQIGFGNCGGIVASNIYLTKESPTYRSGFGVSLALLWLCGVACTIFYLGLRMENQKRERGGRNYRLELPNGELDNLGDDHPNFRFVY